VRLNARRGKGREGIEWVVGVYEVRGERKCLGGKYTYDGRMRRKQVGAERKGLKGGHEDPGCSGEIGGQRNRGKKNCSY